jgi:hypothetical protein
VLAVELRKEKGRQFRLSELRQTGPDRGRKGLLRTDRPFYDSPSRLRCQSWSIPFPRPFPKSVQRQQISVCDCLASVIYTNNIPPVKSFVDSSNNGLDGVCIPFATQCALN